MDGMSEEAAPAKGTLAKAIRDPHWWFKEVVLALIIGGLLAAGTVLGQKMVDDRRAERELHAALAANRHDLQMENLRFVRERSWDTPDDARRFAGFDLADQNLVGLRLTGSDFARADLTGAKLSGSDLSRSNFARATLHDANLTRTVLRGPTSAANASRTPRTNSAPTSPEPIWPTPISPTPTSATPISPGPR